MSCVASIEICYQTNVRLSILWHVNFAPKPHPNTFFTALSDRLKHSTFLKPRYPAPTPFS